jgi:hypothetical protein
LRAAKSGAVSFVAGFDVVDFQLPGTTRNKSMSFSIDTTNQILVSIDISHF